MSESGAIRVNPVSIGEYGTAAQRNFDTVHSTLTTLVSDVVNVHYKGANAIKFKNDAGHMAAAFANNLATDLGTVAQAIKTSTTNIASSLGGQPISIAVDGRTISPPDAGVDDGVVDVSTSGLSGLVSTVGSRFETIRSEIAAHQARLEGTDWTGNAKQNAVASVSAFTSGATSKATAAQEGLVNFIKAQIDSVTTADV